MSRLRRTSLSLSAIALAGLLGACGAEGSSSGTAAPSSGTTSGAMTAPGSASAGGSCERATSQELVVLRDDKQLQTVDNVIPAINARAATPQLIAALDKVAVMTTPELIALNRRVVVDRQSAAAVAKEYVESKGLGTQAAGGSGGSGAVTIGAANFAENEILANVYAEVLRGAGFNPTVRKIGNRELYLPALRKGELQVVPEYAGTLTEFLNKDQNGASAAPQASGDLDRTVQALTTLGQEAGLRFGKPAEAADQNAFAVTKAFADRNGLQTLSDLASKCGGGELILGGPPECPTRPFCQPGLQSTYGLTFDSFSPLDAGGPLTQAALRQGKITLGLVFSSDGSLSG